MVGGVRAVSGFTLAELVIVVVIIGIVSAAVAAFIGGPIGAYFDVSRRAQLSDVADAALRRISRDLQRALPNSVRVAGGCTGAMACYLEYVPVVAGGRYRAKLDQAGGGDILDFTNNDTAFDLIGPNLSLPSATPLWLVVNNLGIRGANVYSGATAASDVRRLYTGPGGSVATIHFRSGAVLPFDSPVHRFDMVSEPVTYACLPSSSGGMLVRYSGYGFSERQPAPPGGNASLLASDVTACSFSYSTPKVASRAGLMSLELQLGRDGETLALFHQVHVPNVL